MPGEVGIKFIIIKNSPKDKNGHNCENLVENRVENPQESFGKCYFLGHHFSLIFLSENWGFIFRFTPLYKLGFVWDKYKNRLS